MQATGVQIDGRSLRGALVRRAGQKLQLIDLKTHEIEESCKSDLHASNTAKNKFFNLFIRGASSTLVSGLQSNDLLIRSRTFTPAKSRKLRQALILQVEAQLHLKAEELITVSLFEAQEKRATTYSTTQPALNAHLEAFHKIHLDPERVSAVPAALKAFVKWKEPDFASYFLLDIGLTSANCIWVENGLLQKAHALSFGLQHLKGFWENKNDSIDFSAIKNSQSAFAEEARTFRREIAKMLHSFQQQRPLIFTGETNDSAFREFLLEGLRECITEEKQLSCTAEERLYAVCIGLAIDYLINIKQPIQFRHGSSLSSQNWQKLGRSGCFLISAAAMLCALIYGTGSWWIDKREKDIIHNLEAWTAEKDPTLRLELFSAGKDTPTLVNQWLRLIEKNAKDYRFLMKAPKVAQFLDWIAHHPLVDSFSQTPDPIFFEQIRYQLVSLPHLDAMDNPYLVKIDLDFKVGSPLHARKFHEMLLQGQGLVDASREISWDVLPDRYRATFYLKNE